MTNDEGFSLVEVVVAAALVALLSTLLFGGIDMSRRAMDAGLKRTDRAAQLSVLDTFLHSHLARANTTPFVGGADGLDFVEPSPDWLTASPVGRISVRAARADADSWKLVAVWQGADAKPHESLILDRLARIEFAYFGNRTGWQPDWRGPAAPSLVKLRLTPTAGQPAEEMIVALRLVTQGDEP